MIVEVRAPDPISEEEGDKWFNTAMANSVKLRASMCHGAEELSSWDEWAQAVSDQ